MIAKSQHIKCLPYSYLRISFTPLFQILWYFKCQLYNSNLYLFLHTKRNHINQYIVCKILWPTLTIFYPRVYLVISFDIIALRKLYKTTSALKLYLKFISRVTEEQNEMPHICLLIIFKCFCNYMYILTKIIKLQVPSNYILSLYLMSSNNMKYHINASLLFLSVSVSICIFLQKS